MNSITDSTLKTQKNNLSVDDFLHSVEPEQRRKDALELLAIMKQVTNEEPVMWGESIVGFGCYHYVYASGREGDWMRIGFSPRKNALTLYIMSGFSKYDELMAKLGKYKTGKSCLYIKKLEDVDKKVLEQLMKASLKYMKQTYPN
jgi:hypothetical protein